MKQKEKDIIQFLRKGKRVNISEIARHLQVPISTVADRIKKIEDRYILKRSSLLDYKRLGYSNNTILAIKVESYIEDPLLSFLKEQSHTNTIFKTNSGYNFIIEVIFKDDLQMIKWVKDVKKRFDAEIQEFKIFKIEEKEKFIP